MSELPLYGRAYEPTCHLRDDEETDHLSNFLNGTKDHLRVRVKKK
jgi:hypothetical protein